MTGRDGSGCRACGKPISQAHYGPARVYCSAKCRTRAYRARRASGPVLPFTAEGPTVVTWPEAPPAPVSWPDRAAIVPPAGDPRQRLEAGVLAAREVKSTMQAVAGSLPPNLAWRAEATADRIGSTLREVWGIGG